MYREIMDSNEVNRLSASLRHAEEMLRHTEGLIKHTELFVAIKKYQDLADRCLNRVEENNLSNDDNTVFLYFAKLFNKFYHELVEILPETVKVDNNFSEWLNSLPDHIQHADKLSKGFEILFNEELLLSGNLLLIEKPQYAIELSKGLTLLKQAKLLNEPNQEILSKYAPYADQIAQGFKYLDESGLLTDLYKNTLLNEDIIKSAGHFAQGLSILKSINLLEEDYKQILKRDSRYATKIATALKTLQKAELLDKKYHLYLNEPQVAKYADAFAEGLHILNQRKILTHSNLKVLFNEAKYSVELATALSVLHEGQIELTDTIYEIIFNNPAYSDKTSAIISLLNKSGFLTTDYINRVKAILTGSYTPRVPENLNKIVQAINKLYGTDIKLATAENMELFFSNPYFANVLSQGIAALHVSGILTKENKKKFVEEVLRCSWEEDGKRISDGLMKVSQAGILTEDVFNLLTDNTRYIFNFSYGLDHLNRVGLFNAENLKWLQEQEITHRVNICFGFIKLGDAGILHEEHFNDLMTHPNIASNLSKGLKTLHLANRLNGENKQALIDTLNHSNWLIIDSISESLEGLCNHRILTQANLDLILSRRQSCEKTSEGLILLSKNHLLDDEHRKKFVAFGVNVEDFSSITSSLQVLSDANLLTEKHFNFLIKNNSSIVFKLSEALVLLDKAKLPIRPNMEKIIKSGQVNVVVDSMKALSSNNILETSTLDALFQKTGKIIKHDNVNGCLTVFSKAGILDKSNFFKLMHGDTAKNFSTACHLNLSITISGKNSQLILDHPWKMKEISLALKALDESNLLADNANNTSFIEAVRSGSDLSKGIQLLQENKLLNQSNFDFLVQNPDHANRLARSFVELSKFGHLTAENKQILTNQAHRSDELALGITTIKSKNFISQDEAEILLIKLIQWPGLGHGLHILSKNNMFTRDHLNFLVQARFSDCYASVARTMTVLDKSNKLDEANKFRLLEYPRHSLLLAKEEGTGFTRKSVVDNQLLDIQKKCRVLGEGRRDSKHIFFDFDPSVLVNIAFLSSTGAIDQRTAIITGNELLKKPVANYRRRVLIVSFGMLSALFSGYGGFLVSAELHLASSAFQSILEQAAIILSFSFIGLVIGVYAGVKLHNYIEDNEENQPMRAKTSEARMSIPR